MYTQQTITVNGRQYVVTYDGVYYRAGCMRATSLLGLQTLIARTVK